MWTITTKYCPNAYFFTFIFSIRYCEFSPTRLWLKGSGPLEILKSHQLKLTRSQRTRQPIDAAYSFSPNRAEQIRLKSRYGFAQRRQLAQWVVCEYVCVCVFLYLAYRYFYICLAYIYIIYALWFYIVFTKFIWGGKALD